MTLAEPLGWSGQVRSALDLQYLISGCLDLDVLLTELAGSLAPFLPVHERVSIAFLEPDGEELRIYRLLPRAELSSGGLPRVPVRGTPIGRVVREGVGRVVNDVRRDPNITFGHASHDGIRSTVSVPVWMGGRVAGVMNAGTHTVGACTAEMVQQLADVAAVVGPAIHAAERVTHLTRARPAAAPARETVEEESTGFHPGGLVGESPAFRSLLEVARRAAQSDADVVLTGETGVGKTALARAIHGWSAKKSGPFLTVHLADLPPTLIESELFGHERGAFTGASSRRIGRFESARDGTIFLDEIGEAPLSIQSKLLRVIQDRSFERVGGGRTIRTDTRIIAATSRDLRESVRRGEFREDLFYRLHVVPLHVPPLRERKEDLEALAGAILARIGVAESRVRTLAPAAWRRLRAHLWPGNIRELESVLRRAAILEDGDELELAGFLEEGTGAGAVPEEWPTLEEHERRYIARVLELRQGQIEGADGAAALLRLRPSTLRSRMKRLGISAQPMRVGMRRRS